MHSPRALHRRTGVRVDRRMAPGAGAPAMTEGALTYAYSHGSGRDAETGQVVVSTRCAWDGGTIVAGPDVDLQAAIAEAIQAHQATRQHDRARRRLHVELPTGGL